MSATLPLDDRPATGPVGWVERGLAPDWLVRAGIRRLCAQRLEEIEAADVERGAHITAQFAQGMRLAPIALVPDLANSQHYEVPAEFFAEVLGPNRKYSCAYWPDGVHDLGQAEELALALTTERAGIEDGHRVLELGCGWGSLTLWMAKHFPRCSITAVSNSRSQRASILARAREQGLDNVEVITADMNRFTHPGGFDRIVSVEMFEHMRNWPELFGRVNAWLKPGGRFFMHVFVHRSTPYPFVDAGDSDWMSRHFFSGGMMPSDDLALHFQDDLRLLQRWRWDGRHYERTANAWLQRIDERRAAVMPTLAATYGEAQAALWLQRWRVFFMACAELFGYRRGQEWFVSHYLFERID